MMNTQSNVVYLSSRDFSQEEIYRSPIFTKRKPFHSNYDYNGVRTMSNSNYSSEIFDRINNLSIDLNSTKEAVFETKDYVANVNLNLKEVQGNVKDIDRTINNFQDDIKKEFESEARSLRAELKSSVSSIIMTLILSALGIIATIVLGFMAIIFG